MKKKKDPLQGLWFSFIFAPEIRGNLFWPAYSAEVLNTSLRIIFLLRTSIITLLGWSNESLPSPNLLKVPSHLS